MRRSIWMDDPKNFEQMRQNFTTTLCIDGPNMTLPDMSEKLCQLHDELQRCRDALAVAEGALNGPSDEYEGCGEALQAVRAALYDESR